MIDFSLSIGSSVISSAAKTFYKVHKDCFEVFIYCQALARKIAKKFFVKLQSIVLHLSFKIPCLTFLQIVIKLFFKFTTRRLSPQQNMFLHLSNARIIFAGASNSDGKNLYNSVPLILCITTDR